MNIGVVTLYSGPLHLSFQKSSAEESQHRSALHEINLGADSQARSPCCLGIGNQLKAARASTATRFSNSKFRQSRSGLGESVPQHSMVEMHEFAQCHVHTCLNLSVQVQHGNVEVWYSTLRGTAIQRLDRSFAPAIHGRPGTVVRLRAIRQPLQDVIGISLVSLGSRGGIKTSRNLLLGWSACVRIATQALHTLLPGNDANCPWPTPATRWRRGSEVTQGAAFPRNGHADG
jgi:hypothetical protein